jgi:hypothetical protein
MIFGGSGDMNDVRPASRQGVADASRERCPEFVGKLRGAIGVGVRNDGDSSSGSSHRVRMPAPHQSGTDDRGS